MKACAGGGQFESGSQCARIYKGMTKAESGKMLVEEEMKDAGGWVVLSTVPV